jgi:hypothetical protein
VLSHRCGARPAAGCADRSRSVRRFAAPACWARRPCPKNSATRSALQATTMTARRRNHVAADLSAENVAEAGTGDRLKIRRRRQYQHLQLSEINPLARHRPGRPNDLAIAPPCPMLIGVIAESVP